MRRSLALLLTSLMLVFSLAACGGGTDQPSDDNGGSNGVTGGDNAAAPGQDGLTGGNIGGTGNDAGGTGNGTGTGSDSQNGGLAGDIKNDLDQAGNNIQSGINDLTGGSPSGINAGGRIGASFDQMVRNGRVHDKDGRLTDNENSVTPGSDRF